MISVRHLFFKKSHKKSWNMCIFVSDARAEQKRKFTSVAKHKVKEEDILLLTLGQFGRTQHPVTLFDYLTHPVALFWLLYAPDCPFQTILCTRWSLVLFLTHPFLRDTLIGRKKIIVNFMNWSRETVVKFVYWPRGRGGWAINRLVGRGKKIEEIFCSTEKRF